MILSSFIVFEDPPAFGLTLVVTIAAYCRQIDLITLNKTRAMQNQMCSRNEYDRRHFERLALPLMHKLYSTALRLAKNTTDAEDILQETYLRAWKSFRTFKPGTNFHGWILRILTNNFINLYNFRKRHFSSVNFEDVREKIPSVSGDSGDTTQTWDETANTERYEHHFDDTVTAALDRLPDYYRVVVLLADVEELRYHEIAAVLDCPLGTVMSRLSRARKGLARSLKRYAVENGFVPALRAEKSGLPNRDLSERQTTESIHLFFGEPE